MYPFDRQYDISDTFADHLIPNKQYPGREKEPGTDFKTPYKTYIRAIWKKTLIDTDVNEYGTRYLVQINPETNQRVDFIHAFVDVPINSIVDEGTIVGRTDGVSDYPSRSSGAHVLVTYRPNWKSNQGYVDVVPFFNELWNESPVQASTPVIANTYFNSEYVPIFFGEGLAAVATRAGLPNPDTDSTWAMIAGLNGYGNDWQGYSYTLQPNQQIKVRNVAPQVQPVIVPTVIVEQAIEKQNEQKEVVKEAIENHVDVVKNVIEDNKETIAQKQAEINSKTLENQKLIDDLNQLVKTAGADYGLENLAFDIIKEEVKSKGVVAKWQAWVDSKVDSNIAKSLLKYDWPWIAFFILTFVGLVAPLYKGDNQIIVGVIAVVLASAGFLLKFLSSNINLDRNKDGVVDLKDTYTYEQILKDKASIS